MVKLTIGMASYNNFQEVWFTLQALRMYQDLTDTELLVIDNYGDDTLRDFIASWAAPQVRYVRYTERQGTAAPRDQVFAQAAGEWVLCIDSHVMLPPGTVARFREWCAAHPECRDLLQGPMLYDDLAQMADAFQDRWEGGMWGVWRGAQVSTEMEPYEIEMMGLGLFACRKDAWLGFNKEHRGFGAEEGYIHSKYRQAGRKTLCLPFLRWVHYFHTRNGKVTCPYTPTQEDKIHNYLTGFAELGLDSAPIYQHFNLIPPAPPARKITNIQIDPNANCGSNCWFCPVRYIERPAGQVMPQLLFESLLDGILDGIKQGSIEEDFTLWLSSYNDILLDPLLAERLHALRARGMKFCCLTNGIGLLSHHQLLHEYRDVVVCYSVDLPAGNPESYAKHTLNPPATFGIILNGLQALHALDPTHYSHAVHVGVNGAHDADWSRKQILYDLPAGDTDLQLQQLQEKLPMYPRVEAMRPLADRAGHLSSHAIDNAVDRPGTAGCNRLTEWLHVNSSGQAYTCCQDYLEAYQYADLTTQTIHEALAAAPGKPFEATRRELCRKCTFAK
ncbi:MAG: hypothetical protein A2075_09040 [Geobacteraceae bacterium GWC2_58_44]|nr:MAG: hypothetical protein A2075_09040 [Geobacteraceae bacterium GWC2_58_44]HBG07658.1 hypothetical protein [Geobacter sp.]